MNALTEESYPAFYERFMMLHDACIKSIQTYFRWGTPFDLDWQELGFHDDYWDKNRTAADRIIRIEMQVIDYAPAAPDDTRVETGIGGRYGALRLDLLGVSEYRVFEEENMCPLEIVFSASFRWDDDLVWIDMCSGDRDESITQIRTSPLYFACKTVYWDIVAGNK